MCGRGREGAVRRGVVRRPDLRPDGRLRERVLGVRGLPHGRMGRLHDGRDLRPGLDDERGLRRDGLPSGLLCRRVGARRRDVRAVPGGELLRGESSTVCYRAALGTAPTR